MDNKDNGIIKDRAKPEKLGTNIYRSRSRAFCILCDKPVDLVIFDKAAGDLKTSHPEVNRMAEKQTLHRVNNSKGVVMICSESLYSLFEMQQTQMLPANLFITNPTESFA